MHKKFYAEIIGMFMTYSNMKVYIFSPSCPLLKTINIKAKYRLDFAQPM